jgi:putative PEP-CTERM system histidine kinase
MEWEPYRAGLYAGCSGAYLLLTVLLLLGRGRSKTGVSLIVICALTAAWAAVVAVRIADFGIAGRIAELADRAAWCGFILHLVQSRYEGRHRGIGLLIGWSVLAAILALGLVPQIVVTVATRPVELPYMLAIAGPIAIAVYGALLVENLYRNTAPDHRWHIKLLCVALGGVFAYDIALYADALLYRRISPILFEGRAVVMISAVPLLAVAAARNRDWTLDVHVSRTAVFHSATLVLSGCFLLALALTGEVIRSTHADWGGVAEMSLLIAGAMTIAVMLVSESARSRLRSTLAAHFFSHRYDYRAEWLRSTGILSAAPNDAGLHTRIIRAVAEIADSPAGSLWVRDLGGNAFLWAGSLNCPAVVISEAADGAFVALFRDGDWTVELDVLPDPPDWLAEIPDAWLAVPLKHLDGLIGFILLVGPRAPVPLDREIFDLLRIVGRQAAAHVAQQQYAQALVESDQLRDYGKRFAFVIHDMKNVVSQLAMITSNAELHKDDPEFHKDVLETVRAALSTMNRLLATVRSRQSQVVQGVIVPAALLPGQIAAIGKTCGTAIILEQDGGSGGVAMDVNHFRAVVTHLCENAIEASKGHIRIHVRHDQARILIDIADKGSGMPAEFVRDELFRPFGSTKRSGFGIGAYQARELIRAAGGDLLVFSRPRVGTTMRILLPCVAGQPGQAPRLSA